VQDKAWVQRVLYELLSFLVALVPEAVKTRDPYQRLATPRGNVFSGVVETAVAATLFIVEMVRYVTTFSLDQGYTAIASMPTSDYGIFMGVGALAFLSFFITPESLVLVYCVAEGLVRTYETALTGRLLGAALVAVPWRLVEILEERAGRARIAVLLGPARPDEVVLPAESHHGLLEVYSIEDKPWSDVQVVELDGVFYRLVAKNLVRRGRHHAYSYELKPTEDREVIRGTIVRYGSGGRPPRQPVRSDTPLGQAGGSGQATRVVPPDRGAFVAARGDTPSKHSPEDEPPVATTRA
jgi:hypothetical protein